MRVRSDEFMTFEDLYTHNFLMRTGTSFEITFIGKDIDGYLWTVKIRRDRKTHTYKAKTPTPSRPKVYELIDDMQKEEPGSFKEFCEKHNMNPETTYSADAYNKATQQYERLSTLFTPAELKEMSRIIDRADMTRERIDWEV